MDIKELLAGAFDLHVHTFPDVQSRSATDLEMARSAKAAGMAGFAIKSHYVPTADRAWAVNQRVKGIHAVGGICLNRSVGGMNPFAVRIAAEHGARIVWFPTMDARHCREWISANLPHHLCLQRELETYGIPVPPISILDEKGGLVKAAADVLTVIKNKDLLLCTGHISQAEGMVLVRTAHQMGIKRILVTHVNWPLTRYTPEQRLELVQNGALLEYSMQDIPAGEGEMERCFAEMREIGPQNCVATSDYGQAGKVRPVEGFGQYLKALCDFGFSPDEVRKMSSENPKLLVV